MDPKELRGLVEAYSEVYAPQQIDEGKVELDQKRRSRMGRQIGKKVRSAEAEYSLSKDTMYPKGLRGAMEKGARKKVGQAQKIMGALKSAQKEEFDIFDMVLEFLQVEGYAETLEEAEWMMANIIDEEAIDIILGEEQLDEISQKTATKAYAYGTSDEFEGQDDPKRVNRNMRLRGRIEKKFGKKAAQHADRAAHAQTFGRKGAGGMPPKPTKEEFELWVDALVEEGYDLSEYTWDDMYEFYLDEAQRPIYSRGGEQRRTQTPRQIGVKSAPHNIPKGGTTVSDRDPEGKRLFSGEQDRGKGSKAARRAAALKPKEKRFPNRLRRADGQGIKDSYEMNGNSLVDEESYSAKAARAGKDIGKPGKQFAKIAKSAAERYGSEERGKKVAGSVLAKLRKEEFELWLDEAMSNYEKNRKRAAQRAAARNAARDAGQTGAVKGVGYVTPRRERETWTDEKGKTRHAKGL